MQRRVRRTLRKSEEVICSKTFSNPVGHVEDSTPTFNPVFNILPPNPKFKVIVEKQKVYLVSIASRTLL